MNIGPIEINLFYMLKVVKVFKEALKIAAIYPLAGVKNELIDVRIQIVKDFKLVYRKREYIGSS